jgi:hypothetical protein
MPVSWQIGADPTTLEGMRKVLAAVRDVAAVVQAEAARERAPINLAVGTVSFFLLAGVFV